MKRSWLIALLGLTLAGLSYGLMLGNRAATVRSLERTCGPELAWIKTEFQLDDATFERVRTLHEAYKPVCADLCRQIDAQHEELAQLLATSDGVTPAITRMVDQANVLRAQCQREMLRHFFEVSRVMPPEQGRRYLAWMHQQTLAPHHASMIPRVGGVADDEHHAH